MAIRMNEAWTCPYYNKVTRNLLAFYFSATLLWTITKTLLSSMPLQITSFWTENLKNCYSAVFDELCDWNPAFNKATKCMHFITLFLTSLSVFVFFPGTSMHISITVWMFNIEKKKEASSMTGSSEDKIGTDF